MASGKKWIFSFIKGHISDEPSFVHSLFFVLFFTLHNKNIENFAIKEYFFLYLSFDRTFFLSFFLTLFI